MRVKLTESEIDKLKPGVKRIEVWDTEVKGLFVRVEPKRADDTFRKVFLVYARTPSGRQIRKSLGEYGQIGLEKARKEAQKVIHEVKFGDPDKVARPARQVVLTLGELCEKYLNEHLAVVADRTSRWNTHTNAKVALLGGRLDEFKDKLVTDLTQDRMEIHYRKLCVQSVSRTNATFDYAKAAWNWGAPEYCPRENPFEISASKRQHLKRRERFLFPSELKQFYHSLQAYRAQGDAERQSRADAVELMLLTGCRVSAAGSLEVQNVRRQDGVMILLEKGSHGHGATRLVKPITARLAQVLDRRPAPEGSLWVFGKQPLRKEHLYRAVDVIAERAGLQGVSPHVLRHTYVSYARVAPRQGLSIQEVAQQVGHARTQMTQRYTHAMTPVDASNAQAIEDYLLAVIQDGSNVVQLKRA